jgi:hypothetical protein
VMALFLHGMATFTDSIYLNFALHLICWYL